MPYSTQSRSFWRQTSQPITRLILTNKTVQHKLLLRKSKQHKKLQNKTTLVQSPFTTLGREIRWANSRTFKSPHGANDDVNVYMNLYCAYMLLM